MPCLITREYLSKIVMTLFALAATLPRTSLRLNSVSLMLGETCTAPTGQYGPVQTAKSDINEPMKPNMDPQKCLRKVISTIFSYILKITMLGFLLAEACGRVL